MGNHATQQLEIKSRQTKCLHIYQYWNHPLYGLIHGRIQTWYPYNIQFYINGREFLKRQMDFKNISYRKADNAFLWISDLDKANKLAQKQVVFNWQKTFDDFALQVNPLLTESLPKGTNYYWTLAQSEWATDILFKDQKALENIYPDLVHYSMKTFNSPDVMKFLGKKLTIENWINGNFTGEVISDYKDRPEGCRVKHSVKSNSVKIYDKAGSVLRVETTINRPQEFKSYRPKLSTGDMAWQPMRKSIDDISRRAEVSDNINKKYLTALASANTERKFTSIVDAISEPITKNGYRVRGIDPFVKDRDILDIIINGKFHINGFRNRDIRKDLFSCQGIEQSKKDSAKVSRRLRILRTHGLIKKVTKTHRYMMTDRGIELISALKTIESTPVDTLLKMAA